MYGELGLVFYLQVLSENFYVSGFPEVMQREPGLNFLASGFLSELLRVRFYLGVCAGSRFLLFSGFKGL